MRSSAGTGTRSTPARGPATGRARSGTIAPRGRSAATAAARRRAARGRRTAAPAVPRGAPPPARGAPAAGDRGPRGGDRRPPRRRPASWTSFPRATGSCGPPGTCRDQQDIYVSLSQIRRFMLRKGDDRHGRGPAAQGQREVLRAAADRLRERDGPRAGASSGRTSRSSRRCSRTSGSAWSTGRRRDRADHRPGRADRQGPARDGGLAAEGREDHRPQADRERDPQARSPRPT